MKLLVLCLTVCVAFAFAEETSQLGSLHPSASGTVGTDACIWAQTYSFAALDNGLRHGAPGWIADDFILASSAYVQNVRFWIVYTGATVPTSYELAFAVDTGDSDPTTSTVVWTETVPCTNVDTGDTNWGYIIWEITCAIPATDVYPLINAGDRYWLEIKFHDDTTNDYVLNQLPIWGSYPYTGDGTVPPIWERVDIWYAPADLFFELYDSPVALQRETWGSIKSVF